MFETQLGEIYQGKLYAYQIVKGEKIEIESDFLIISNDIVSFGIKEYNNDLALVIDPLIWSTLIGGSAHETIEDTSADASGNVVVVGYTNGGDFPTTKGAYDESLMEDKI